MVIIEPSRKNCHENVKPIIYWNRQFSPQSYFSGFSSEHK